MTTTELVLGALATFRLTWLLSADDITKPIRRAIDGLGRPKLSTLITCQWCLSIWFGALVAVAAWRLEGAWFTVPAAALSFSAVAGLLANRAKEAASIANHPEPEVVIMPADPIPEEKDEQDAPPQSPGASDPGEPGYDGDVTVGDDAAEGTWAEDEPAEALGRHRG